MARNTPVEPVALEFSKFDIIVDANSLPQASVHFLLRYGFKQLLSDSMAGKAKEPDAAKAAVETRLTQILDGSVGVRVVAERKPKGRTVEQFIREVAKERLTALAKAKGMSLPKGENLDKMLAMIAAKDPSIATEAQSRFDAANSFAGDDDIFAALIEAQAPVEPGEGDTTPTE